jgi:hypothetical protein
MTLRMVGAGVGRTGTESLKLALEHLLGGRCYHMLEVLTHPESVMYWASAGRGEMPDWDQVFDGYVAAVDWPVAAYWPELSAAFPDAPVLLSTRASAEEWYRSASQTRADPPCGRPGAQASRNPACQPEAVPGALLPRIPSNFGPRRTRNSPSRARGMARYMTSRRAKQFLLVVTKTSIHGEANSHRGKPKSHGGPPMSSPPMGSGSRGHSVATPDAVRYQGGAAE